MARIKLLDEDTINKIAAGEVIERPASVVKELVENSIDAGAGKVLIELGDGGKSFIRITDDGSGIDPQDLPSGLSEACHLQDQRSQRPGEYRHPGLSGRGTGQHCQRLEERRGKNQDQRLPLRHLPAHGGRQDCRDKRGRLSSGNHHHRLGPLLQCSCQKKAPQRGGGGNCVHITDMVTEMAIIHYDISFELFSGKRTIFKSIRSSSWDDVLFRLFGLKTLKGMARLEEPGRGWTLSGVIGDPLAVRSSPDRIFIFVNGRAVSSRTLSAAVREAYRNIIPLGKSPVAVISLQISPELVDVNVHPAKREIRLLHEQEIASALTQAAARALEEHAKPAPEEMPGEVPRQESMLPCQAGHHRGKL